MSAYLLAEEGPLSGLIIRFEEGDEWMIGRDPDVSFQVLEDPMVSRRHVMCRESEEGYVIENLSSVNPASVNGEPVTEPTLLHEGDTVQIGNTFFRFTESDPSIANHTPVPEEDEEEISSESPLFFEEEEVTPLSFAAEHDARWIVKVISGPNSGAEFPLQAGKSYILGKDPIHCDILFQDLSVSREHAKLSVSEDGNQVLAEDLNSRNGSLINGKPIHESKELSSQDLMALGTTSFLVIDCEQTRDTIYSPPSIIEEEISEEETPATEAIEKEKTLRSWRATIIPFRHLAIALLFVVLLFIGIGGVISLFKSHTVEMVKKDEASEIRDAIGQFSTVQFSWNPNTGKIFLVGNVITEVDHQELIYLLKTLPFIDDIEDNVVIDELVWENMNALFIKNPNWRGVSLTSSKPGHFILRGYLQTQEELATLLEFVNVNFPYTDRIENHVAVDQTLQTQIQSILLESGFMNVTFQLTNGELILAGRVNEQNEDAFVKAVGEIKGIQGIRMLKNFVIFTSGTTARRDLSQKYQVTGSSKFGNVNEFVVIGGKILSVGDNFDGMLITGIEPNAVLLEKDGLKYRIDYNQQ